MSKSTDSLVLGQCEDELETSPDSPPQTQRVAENAQRLKDEQEINAALARVPGNHEHIWLVTDGMCRFMDVDYNCQGVEDFVEKYYTVERSESFSNLRARLLRRNR